MGFNLIICPRASLLAVSNAKTIFLSQVRLLASNAVDKAATYLYLPGVKHHTVQALEELTTQLETI